MENFNLYRSKPTKEFDFNSSESYLRIASIILMKDDNSKLNWTQLISMLQITAEMKYIVYSDKEGRFTDDRTLTFPIHIPIDPDQVQPVFNINKLIKNEVLKIGLNPAEKHYSHFKIELIENQLITENYYLQFLVEKFKTDDR